METRPLSGVFSPYQLALSFKLLVGAEYDRNNWLYVIKYCDQMIVALNEIPQEKQDSNHFFHLAYAWHTKAKCYFKQFNKDQTLSALQTATDMLTKMPNGTLEAAKLLREIYSFLNTVIDPDCKIDNLLNKNHKQWSVVYSATDTKNFKLLHHLLQVQAELSDLKEEVKKLKMDNTELRATMAHNAEQAAKKHDCLLVKKGFFKHKEVKIRPIWPRDNRPYR